MPQARFTIAFERDSSEETCHETDFACPCGGNGQPLRRPETNRTCWAQWRVDLGLFRLRCRSKRLRQSRFRHSIGDARGIQRRSRPLCEPSRGRLRLPGHQRLACSQRIGRQPGKALGHRSRRLRSPQRHRRTICRHQCGRLLRQASLRSLVRLSIQSIARRQRVRARWIPTGEYAIRERVSLARHLPCEGQWLLGFGRGAYRNQS